MAVKSDDILEELKLVRASLVRVVESAAERRPGEVDVWPIYAKSERLAAVLKFRLGVERPGVFLELPRSDRPDEFLPAALEAMWAAERSLESGDRIEGLESIRKARTLLRAFLADLRRARMRERRRAAAASRSSSV